MNWEGFVYALDMIEAKTDDAKIDLFMRVRKIGFLMWIYSFFIDICLFFFKKLLDEDLSGTISYNEIFD